MTAAPDMLVQLTTSQLRELVREAVKEGVAAAQNDAPVFLKLADAARLLKCSEKSVLRRIRNDGLPAEKLGAEWRFEQSKLLEFMRKAAG